MLQGIHIAGQATYAADGQRLEPCKQINFIFGTNGSGKTTISRVIADPVARPGCQLIWAGDQQIERLIYNSDFVERNFTTTLKGIFTLGEESAETLEKIEKAKDARHKHQEGLGSLQANLNGPDGNAGKVSDLSQG